MNSDIKRWHGACSNGEKFIIGGSKNSHLCISCAAFEASINTATKAFSDVENTHLKVYDSEKGINLFELTEMQQHSYQ